MKRQGLLFVTSFGIKVGRPQELLPECWDPYTKGCNSSYRYIYMGNANNDMVVTSLFVNQLILVSLLCAMPII